MAHIQFCDSCARSIPDADPRFEADQGRVLCRACWNEEKPTSRDRVQELIEDRRQKKLLGQIVTVAVALLVVAAVTVVANHYNLFSGDDAPLAAAEDTADARRTPEEVSPSSTGEGEFTEQTQRDLYQTALRFIQANHPEDWTNPDYSPADHSLTTYVPLEDVSGYRVSILVWPEGPGEGEVPLSYTNELVPDGSAWSVRSSRLTNLGTGEFIPLTAAVTDSSARNEKSSVAESESVVDPASALIDEWADAPEEIPVDAPATSPDTAPSSYLFVGAVEDDSRFVGRYVNRVKRSAGPKQARVAVDGGLAWLKNHQAPDGSWSCSRFSEQCGDDACDGVGDRAHDLGVTSLALLAFLGAGHTPTFGEHSDVVRRGLQYLVKVQDRDTGCFGVVEAHNSFLYDHALATLAIIEAYGLTGAPALEGPAQDGIDFILEARNETAGWRYRYPPNGRSDVSVTGWMLTALAAGIEFGLAVERAAFDGAGRFIEEMTDQKSWRTGYMSTGGYSSREIKMSQYWPESKTEAMTAVAMLCRMALGERPSSNKALQGGGRLLAQLPPTWDPESGCIDFYYWYQATYAMFQMGGGFWKVWEPAMLQVITDAQERGGHEDGSWNPRHGPWGKRGGRIYATAIMTLCLEVYDRFTPGGPTSPVRAAGGRASHDAPGEGVSELLRALLEDFEKARGDRSKLSRIEKRLERYSRKKSASDRQVALLYRGYAIAEAGDLLPDRKERARVDCYCDATIPLRDLMALETDFLLDGKACRHLAAELRLKLHGNCLGYYERKRDTDDSYSDFQFKNDAGYHIRGIKDCKALLKE